MDKWENIIRKKEDIFMAGEDFADKYPEFFQLVGKEIIESDGSKIYEGENIKISLKTKNLPQGFEEVTDESLFKALNRFEKYHRRDEYEQLIEFRLESNGRILDIFSGAIKPIIFIEKGSTVEVSGQAFVKENLTVLQAPPITPRGIFTMMHEIGHLDDAKNIIEENMRASDLHFQSVMRGGATGMMDKEKDAIVLRQERFAWANALSKLRPFLKSFNITDEGIDALIHKFTLGSYCKNMSTDYED